MTKRLRIWRRVNLRTRARVVLHLLLQALCQQRQEARRRSPESSAPLVQRGSGPWTETKSSIRHASTAKERRQSFFTRFVSSISVFLSFTLSQFTFVSLLSLVVAEKRAFYVACCRWHCPKSLLYALITKYIRSFTVILPRRGVHVGVCPTKAQVS